MVCNIAQSIISPFYPTFAKQHGISEEIIGYIFSAHPIGQLIASLILGKIINKKNRSLLINIGIIVQGGSLLIFGMLYFVDKKNILILLSIIARLIGGFGAATFMTPFYAYIPLLYPESVEQKIAMAEVSTSLGFLVGPILGSFLFGIGGFILPFFFFAGISFILGIILPFSYKTLNQSIIQQDNTTIQENQSLLVQDFQISYLQLSLQYPIISGFLINTTANCVWTFYSPTMAPYLSEAYKVAPSDAGYYISLNALTFALGAVFVSRIRSYYKYYMYFGLVITGYLQFFLGPDYIYTNLQQNKWVSITIWGTVGFTASFPYILAMPLFNSILQKYYPRYPHQCANIASALFNSSLAAGELIGPIISGYLVSYFGFERSASIFGIAILVISLIFLPFLFMDNLKKLKIIH